jgi:hypothetical protein
MPHCRGRNLGLVIAKPQKPNKASILDLLLGSAPGSLPPEIPGKHDTPRHDNHIGHIENAGVKRTDADENKVTHQPVSQNAVDQVTGAARPNQPSANETRPAEPACEYEVRQKAEQADRDRNRKQGEAQRIRKLISQAEESARIFSQAKLAKSARQGDKAVLTQFATGKMF